MVLVEHKAASIIQLAKNKGDTMKKLFLVLSLLALAGVSHAANIPGAVDPKGGPEVWTVPVYNNSGGTLDVGDVVIWDIVSSTGDNDNYVTTTTTADYTGPVAGVVYPADIAAGDSGTIAIYGVVQVDAIAAHLTSDNALACTSTTAGSAKSCTTNPAAFGFVTTGNTGTSANVCVNCQINGAN